jgi:MFS family permease
MDTEDTKTFSLVGAGISLNYKTPDEVLEEMGFGRFHFRLLSLACLTVACQAIELNLLTYLQVCAGVEWNLSSSSKALLTCGVFLGQIIGLVLAGPMADTYGRKPVILFSWAAIAVFGMLSAVSPNVWVLLCLRALVGAGIASQVVFFDLLSELLPIDIRGRCLTFSLIFFAIGDTCTTGLAYLLLDAYGWRWMVFAASCPFAIIFFIGLLLILESPRYLLVNHQVMEAETVLMNIGIVNEFVIPAYSLKLCRHETCTENSANIYAWLLSRKLRHATLLIWPLWYLSILKTYVITVTDQCCNRFCFTFSYYSLSFLLVDYFEIDDSCSFRFNYIVLVDISGVVGTAIATQLIDSIVRKISQFFLFLIAFGSILVFAFFNETVAETLVFVMVAKSAIMGGTSLCWVQCTELYPTEVNPALCICNSV